MFFFLSKVLWFLIAPFNLALFALTGAVFAMWRKMHALARILGVGAWAILMIFGVLPTGQLLTGFLESRYAIPDPMPGRVDGIIVLGGVIDTDKALTRGEPQLNGSSERIGTFVTLARKYPWAKQVFTSGLGGITQTGTPEGAMIKDVLRNYGFNPTSRFVIEDQSRNTFENATLSKERVQPKPGQTWLLVTSAWHMPRAVGVFRKTGWDVVPYPTDYLTPGHYSFLEKMELSNTAIREMLGIAMYAITGKWK